jgi:hypothetical protein
MNTIQPAAENMRPGVDDRFGLCPECVEAGEFGAEQTWANIERNHFIYCEKHQTSWRVGSNLFSSWRHESQKLWEQNAAVLEKMKEVEPRYLPESEASIKRRANREWQVKALFTSMSESKQDVILALMCELSAHKISPDGLGISRTNDFLPF